jgi:hypothetical protein
MVIIGQNIKPLLRLLLIKGSLLELLSKPLVLTNVIVILLGVVNALNQVSVSNVRSGLDHLDDFSSFHCQH